MPEKKRATEEIRYLNGRAKCLLCATWLSISSVPYDPKKDLVSQEVVLGNRLAKEWKIHASSQHAHIGYDMSNVQISVIPSHTHP